MKVVMTGESLLKQGGIVSVQKLILSEMSSEIQFQHIATLVDGSAPQKNIAFLRGILKLCWMLLSQKVDLIHAHVSERGSAFRQAVVTCIALLFRKPIVMHTHGSEFHIFYEKLPVSIKKILNFVYSRCTHFIVLSDYWKDFYVQNLGLKIERVTVLKNAVKIPESIPDRTYSNSISFLFLGRIGQRKGTFDLVRAFADLSQNYQIEAKLTIAGDGEGVQLRSLINSLNLSKYISVMDWVDAVQRDYLLKQSDVFILPSYNEALPMAILEAMSWGLPIVSTPVGGIPEIVHSGENGLLIEPGNIEQLKAAMKLLIEDGELRLKLGQAARKSILPLDVKLYCAALTQIYQSTVEKVAS